MSFISLVLCVQTVLRMKKAVFWDVAPCRSGVNRRFGGTYRLHLQGRGEIRKFAREVSVRDVKSSLLLLYLHVIKVLMFVVP
jgi:hypothetical protein